MLQGIPPRLMLWRLVMVAFVFRSNRRLRQIVLAAGAHSDTFRPKRNSIAPDVPQLRPDVPIGHRREPIVSRRCAPRDRGRN